MPFFEPDEARKMLADTSVTEDVLDLRGLSRMDALRRLDTAINAPPDGKSRSLLIRLESPEEAGGETLFQPIGQRLLKAKRRSLIDRVLTVQQPGGGGGYLIECRATESRPKTV